MTGPHIVSDAIKDGYNNYAASGPDGITASRMDKGQSHCGDQ